MCSYFPTRSAWELQNKQTSAIILTSLVHMYGSHQVIRFPPLLHNQSLYEEHFVSATKKAKERKVDHFCLSIGLWWVDLAFTDTSSPALFPVMNMPVSALP